MSDVCQATRRKKLAKKTGLPRHVKDMSKEQLDAAIKKKRECNAKALTIVEQMLEPRISEDWFLKQLMFIDVGHFQDIIEERALCKLCAYPLCAENLKNLVSQQFRISTKYNKVYDITERKNFCSNLCYKASKYVKDQLLTSPLWLRDKEDIPVFKLLPLGTQGTGAGEEVDFGQKNLLKSEVTRLNKDDKFVSVADYTQDSISQLSQKIHNLEMKENSESGDSKFDGISFQKVEKEFVNTTGNHSVSLQDNCGAKDTASTKEFDGNVMNTEKLENKQDQETCKNYEECLKTDPKCESAIQNSTNNENCTRKALNKKYGTNGKKSESSKKDTYEQTKDVKNKECTEIASSVIHIEKCLNEWFTIDTMCYLFGDEKVKDLVCDKGECIKEYYKTVGKSSWDPVIQDRYEALCRKLKIMEIQEQQHDKEERQLKPLPDYNVLKKESMNNDIKIQAFYQGQAAYDIPTNINIENYGNYTPSCVLPLVDIHAQNALRRRMVLDNLKRVLPDLLCTFGLASRDVSSDVRYLVSSFSLSAHNITFSPAEWNLLGLIIIKMLSIKDMRLKILLETSQGLKYQTMLLMAFQQDGGYLERLMVWLTDIDSIMKKS